MEVETKTFVGYTPLPRIEHQRGYSIVPELRDKAWIQKMVDQEMSTHDIADLLGCTQSLVSKWMNRLGVKAAYRKGYQTEACTDPRLHDPAWLRENYVSIGRTLKAMAIELGCSQHTLTASFKKHCIEKRGPITAAEIEIPEWEDYPERRQEKLTKDVICLYVARAYNVRVEIVGNHGVYLGSQHSAKKDGINGQAWHARRVAIWLTRNLLGWSATRIGREWGYKSGDRALAAFRVIDRYAKSCPAYAEELRRVAQDIEERN